MEKITIEVNDLSKVSDGYHTIQELYEHRCVLFMCLLKFTSNNSSINTWKSLKHDDGTMFDGWFVAGIDTSKHGQMTYHLPIGDWDKLYNVKELESAPKWDGHTSDDVLKRLTKYFLETDDFNNY